MATFFASPSTPLKFSTYKHAGSFTATTGTSTTISVTLAANTLFTIFSARNSSAHVLLANTSANTKTIFIATNGVSKTGGTIKIRHKSGVSSAKINYFVVY